MKTDVFKPRCETLEDRLTPAASANLMPPFVQETVFTVTTVADVVDANDGVLSLREAIAETQSEPAPDQQYANRVVKFADELAGKTINVSQIGGSTYGAAAFELKRPVSIRGSGQKITRETSAAHMRFFTLLGGQPAGIDGSLSLDKVELVGGYSDGYGGAVYNNGSNLFASNSTFAGNSALAYGGAVFSVGGYNTLSTSTLSDNTTRPNVDGISAGGAIYSIGSAGGGGFLSIGSSTLAGNIAQHGSQVFTDGAGFSATNSILYTASAATGGAADLQIYNNDIVRTAVVRDPDRNIIGKAIGYDELNVSSADPLLGQLQDNGGPTRTRLLQTGSAAIDTAGGYNRDSSRDQRGYVRGVGLKNDLGALEAGATLDGKTYEPPSFATGAAKGSPPEVKLYTADGKPYKTFLAYAPNFLGGVEVAMADMNADGVPDVVTAAKSGGGPHVRIFDGVTFKEIRGFFAFDQGFNGGVSLAMGDVNNDGIADIVVGAGAGGGPHVKVFDGKSGELLKSIFAFDAGFRGGVNVAVASNYSLTGLIVGAGPGGGPHVKILNPDTLAVERSFLAYDPGFNGGVNVASVNGHVVTGTQTGAPHVKAFRDNRRYNEVAGSTGLPEVVSFFAGDLTSTTGVVVGSAQALVWPPDNRPITYFAVNPGNAQLYTSVGQGTLNRHSLAIEDQYTPDNYENPIIRTQLISDPLTTPITGSLGSFSGIEPLYAIPVFLPAAQSVITTTN